MSLILNLAKHYVFRESEFISLSSSWEDLLFFLFKEDHFNIFETNLIKFKSKSKFIDLLLNILSRYNLVINFNSVYGETYTKYYRFLAREYVKYFRCHRLNVE
jgi:hypothetical protein